MKNQEIGDVFLMEAELGNVDAMVNWATWRTVHNLDVPLTDEEVKRVLKYYNAGVEAQNSTACLNLGAIYYDGVYVEQDYKTAAQLYEKAASLGEAQALCNLGYCYYYGRHTEVDYKMAYICFSQAALLDNNCNAYYKLGDMHMNGKFVEKNEKFGFDLYEKALDELDQNDPNMLQADIYMRIGECYLYGKGCEVDIISALRYLTQSECYFYKRLLANVPNSQYGFERVRKLIEIGKEQIEASLCIANDVM